MSSIPLNIFQKLMRKWDHVHPYNAAQVMLLKGTPDHNQWETAWQATLQDMRLGPVKVGRSHYEYLVATPVSRQVQTPQISLEDHLSNEMNRSFDDPTECPFRPFLIRNENTFYAGLVYQHWLADSTSIRMLIREWFMRVYDPPNACTCAIPLVTRGYWNTIGPGRSGWGFTESLLEMTRRHVRLRRVQKIASTALADHTTRFQLIASPPALIDQLRIAARQRSVKVNDIFLAALLESAAEHVPLQPRLNRRDVAVGSVVDLRPYAPADVAEQFGLFLGFTNVIAQPQDLPDFNRLLQAIAQQTRLQKSTGVAPASLMWMSAAMVIGKLSKPGELYHFYRKELPLAGGLSNVDLTHTWIANYHPDPLLEYFRISPTGPMTPLVITTTTLGDQLHLGLTHRTGLIPPPLANQIASAFVERLVALSHR